MIEGLFLALGFLFLMFYVFMLVSFRRLSDEVSGLYSLVSKLRAQVSALSASIESSHESHSG